MSIGSTRDHLLRMAADALALGLDGITAHRCPEALVDELAVITGRPCNESVYVSHATGDGPRMYTRWASGDVGGCEITAFHSRPATAADIAAHEAREAVRAREVAA